MYGSEDFDLLEGLAAGASERCTTTNVWTEVANLPGFRADRREIYEFAGAMSRCMNASVELYPVGLKVMEDDTFMALGLTDCGLLAILDDRTTLLTTDVGLYEYALSRGLAVYNFHHIREDRALA
jgi:hypothetical protein